MHTVLAAETENPAFTPEPFGKLYQRSLYQSLRNLVGKTTTLLRRRLSGLPESSQNLGRQLLDRVTDILQRFQAVINRKMTGLRTRYHGDYHLGQVLYTGKDFILVDFEGEPARSLNDRRQKRSPLRDVAKMALSFHNAAYSALFGYQSSRGTTPGVFRPDDVPTLETWAHFWYHWVSVSFANAYLQATEGQKYVPQSHEEFTWTLELFMLEKALYELEAELTHRPDWVQIPLRSLLKLLETSS
jgi:maltose alpha-D-glucosyltransferase/alpha-amylase